MQYIDEDIKKFCDRKYLRRKNTIIIKNNKHREYIYIDNPLIMTRIIGYVMKRSINSNVFIRGQVNDHKGMIPSIFRNNHNNDEKLEALKELKMNIRSITGLKRFDDEIGTAILQHYGIKTYFLDVVDNLFIGLWFAINKQSEDEPIKYHSIINNYGWIYLLSPETKFIDLRKSHSSLSLRPHCQHGIFISGDEINLKDLDHYVIATIKFPTNNFVGIINGINQTFMFPHPYYDNTYKKLLNINISKMITDIELKYNLHKGEIGRIHRYY